MSAGKGPRARPLDGSSVHRSSTGGLSARAAGGKGFGMIGHTGSHGRSMVARVRGAAGGVSRIYVTGESYGPTFCGIATGGAGSVRNAVVAAMDLDGAFLWAWADGLTATYDNGGYAIAADASGCYVAHHRSASAWGITKLDGADGSVVWTVDCTASYSLAPLHIETRDGYVYAAGSGDRNLWIIHATTGATILQVTGYDAGFDISVENAESYPGTVAAGSGNVGYVANTFTATSTDGAIHHRGLRYGTSGIEADDGFYTDYFSPSTERFVQAVGLPGDVWGLWVRSWGATDWVNVWDSGYIYAAGDVVTGPTGGGYVSLQNANQNHDPDVSATWWREWTWGSDPITGGYFLQRRDSSLASVNTPINTGTYTGYTQDTVPAVDMSTGLIVTNIWDPDDVFPTLTAYDSSGSELWSIADGVYFTGVASAVAAGSDRVVAASADPSPFVVASYLDILDPASGSRLVPQLTVGDDSTDGYNYRSVAIG